MGWIQRLCETYDNNKGMVGVIEEGKYPLPPISHILANAQIEITITEGGDFYRAQVVDKDDKVTFIPVTEESAGRSSGIAPHPLSDTLSYVAGDFSVYLGESQKEKNNADNKFQAYIEQLQHWEQSEYSHDKVKAIYSYCMKGQVCSDLIRSEILKCDEKGEFLPEKIMGNVYEKCLVRWRVLSLKNPDQTSAAWEDSTLFSQYIQYINSLNDTENSAVCYVTGEKKAIAVNHPKGIIASSYGAKLLSANDATGFTYRGRFLEGEEAYAVSYEATQKAHNALRWLIANQGITMGGRTFLCWNPNGKSIPAVGQNNFRDDEDDEPRNYTMPLYQKRLFKTFQGYRDELKEQDDIYIIALEAATTGRLSVTYYNELKASDFLERLEKWQTTCCWYFTRFTVDKKPYQDIGTPSINRIIDYAYGTEQNGSVKADDKIIKEHFQRLFHCIVNNSELPGDIVHMIANRASMPLVYSYGNHERVLSTACALLNKYYHTYEREENGMELDLKERNRSYLFGRLLAIAEKVERSTYLNDEKRETNAVRMQAAFQQHPLHTWRIIEESLNPYYQKMKPGSRKYYKDLIGDILANLFIEDAGKLNQNLEDNYLLGYYLQRRVFNTKKDENQEEE